MTYPNPLTSKETHFLEAWKIAFKWANMLDKEEDSNTKEVDKQVQTIKKPYRGRPKKVILNLPKQKNL